jgi:hypothetical protein
MMKFQVLGVTGLVGERFELDRIMTTEEAHTRNCDRAIMSVAELDCGASPRNPLLPTPMSQASVRLIKKHY